MAKEKKKVAPTLAKEDRPFVGGRKQSSKQFKEYVDELNLHDKLTLKVPLTIDDLTSDEGLILLACWTREGATYTDIANMIGLSYEQFRRYRRKYPEIQQACTQSKEIVNAKVEDALLKCALGYTKTTTKTYLGKVHPNGNRDVGSETTIEEVGPNPQACLAWLYNQKQDKWKNYNRAQDSMTSTDDGDGNITINIIKGAPNDQPSWLDEEDDE